MPTNQLTNPALIKLLHLADPTLPIGAYTHSNGLETYVQYNLISNKAQLQDFLQQQLLENWVYNDLAFVRQAYGYAKQSALEELVALGELIHALKSAAELRSASLKLGQRIYKIFREYVDDELLRGFNQALEEKRLIPHYALVFGVYAAALNLELAASLSAFGYNLLMGMITNGVKLIPLGQLEGQAIFFALESKIAEAVSNTMQLAEQDIGRCSVGLELRSMQHETLYSRLYMS